MMHPTDKECAEGAVAQTSCIHCHASTPASESTAEAAISLAKASSIVSASSSNKITEFLWSAQYHVSAAPHRGIAQTELKRLESSRTVPCFARTIERGEERVVLFPNQRGAIPFIHLDNCT